MRPLQLFLLLPFAVISTAFACPNIARLPDANCDGTLTVAVIGDSLVWGIGDVANNNHGGYVLRASKLYRQATFENLGEAGLNTRQLVMELHDAFAAKDDTSKWQGLAEADIVVLDVGRNDRWFFGLPSQTWRNLKRVRKMIVQQARKESRQPPVVVTAVMMYPNRGSQGPWMKVLDEIILQHSTPSAPANLRFDLVSKRLLSSDQIHPTPAGYLALAKVLVSYLKRDLPALLAKLNRTPTPTPSLTATPLPEPTATPEPTVTPVPTEVPTAIPTETVTATPTITPTV